MGNYQIKVNIEIVECDDEQKDRVCLENNGSFTMKINEKDAESIDKCESSLLATAHPAIRKALAKHFEEMSKKKVMKKRRKGRE